MSHTSTVTTIKIQSITALRAAINELAAAGIRCSLLERQAPRAYFQGQQGMGVADYVVKLDNCAYDIGLYRTDEGGYEARTDFWGGSIERELGVTPTKPEAAQQAKLGRLFQAYGIHAATEAARKKGHMVRRVNMPNGTVKLEVTGANL